VFEAVEVERVERADLAHVDIEAMMSGWQVRVDVQPDLGEARRPRRLASMPAADVEKRLART
jgi:hypothetical protein